MLPGPIPEILAEGDLFRADLAMAAPSSCAAAEPEMGAEQEEAEKAAPGQETEDLGLALSWDNRAVVRQRMRDGWNLLIHYDPKLKVYANCKLERSVCNVKHNFSVLRPVCQLACVREGLPPVEQLEREVKQLFSFYSVPATRETIHEQGWAIRHMLAVLKGTMRTDKANGKSLKRLPKDPPRNKFLNH